MSLVFLVVDLDGCLVVGMIWRGFKVSSLEVNFFELTNVEVDHL